MLTGGALGEADAPPGKSPEVSGSGAEPGAGLPRRRLNPQFLGFFLNGGGAMESSSGSCRLPELPLGVAEATVMSPLSTPAKFKPDLGPGSLPALQGATWFSAMIIQQLGRVIQEQSNGYMWERK